MPRILEGCSLGFMKRHDNKFDPRLSRSSRQPVAFIREGKAGGGKSVLNLAQQQLLADKLARLEEKLGVSAQDLGIPSGRPGPPISP